MITIKKDVFINTDKRKALAALVNEDTYFTVANKTVFDASAFSDLICEGYLLQTEMGTFIADYEEGTERLSQVLGADGLKREEMLNAMEKQLVIEAKSYERGIDAGKYLKLIEIKRVLGI